MSTHVRSYIYLGSIGMEGVISESCYKGTILQRNDGHFPIFPGATMHDSVISKSVL